MNWLHGSSSAQLPRAVLPVTGGHWCRGCMQRQAQEQIQDLTQRLEAAQAAAADLCEDVEAARAEMAQSTAAAETAQEQVQLLRSGRLSAEAQAAEMVGRLEAADDKLRAAQAALQERRLEAEVSGSPGPVQRCHAASRTAQNPTHQDSGWIVSRLFSMARYRFLALESY